MLPTREEAKELKETITSLYTSGCLNQMIRLSNLEIDYLYKIKNILEAYSSGTLIEARTEGEIIKIIDSEVNLVLHAKERLAHALAGKV
jgi:hypothetical protein